MNNQFQSARIRLTLWYTAMLMIVALVFSMVVYISLNAELLRAGRREQQKLVAEKLNIVLPKPLPDPKDLRPELVNPVLTGEIKDTYLYSRSLLIMQLLVANAVVLGLSASAAYLLAGKTLRPIQLMVQEQKKFIANASHELRTPLTSLKMAIEVTLRMGEAAYPQIKEILQDNLEDVQNLERLTNNLLIIEKYAPGTKHHTTNAVQFDTLIVSCVDKLKSKAENAKVHISTSLKPCQIVGNESALREMVANLLDNAIKYNKPEGVIQVALEPQGRSAKLLVSDTGIGIAEKDLPHIFERFYRADHSRSKTDITGYGLGLSIVSQVVNEHKGSIATHSKHGVGTTFTILLPLHS